MRAATVEKIKEFLALPVEAMPACCWADGDEQPAWDALRGFVCDGFLDDNLIISADMDGWRDGFLVEVQP